MLNLIFDFSNSDGQFEVGADPNPLETSMHWLKWIGASEPDASAHTFNPETPTDWTDVGSAGAVLIENHLVPGQWLGVRIVPKAANNLPAGTKLSLAVAFGKPAIATQPHASPFALPDGSIKTTFVPSDAMNTPPSGGQKKGWFFHLDKIAIAPGYGQSVVHRYQFAVGVIVEKPGQPGSSSTFRHYGQDPDMDIGY